MVLNNITSKCANWSSKSRSTYFLKIIPNIYLHYFSIPDKEKNNLMRKKLTRKETLPSVCFFHPIRNLREEKLFIYSNKLENLKAENLFPKPYISFLNIILLKFEKFLVLQNLILKFKWKIIIKFVLIELEKFAIYYM